MIVNENQPINNISWLNILFDLQTHNCLITVHCSTADVCISCKILMHRHNINELMIDEIIMYSWNLLKIVQSLCVT